MKHEDMLAVVKDQYEKVVGKPPYQVKPTIEDGHIVNIWVCEEPDEKGWARCVDISVDSRFPEWKIRHSVEVYVEYMMLQEAPPE